MNQGERVRETCKSTAGAHRLDPLDDVGRAEAETQAVDVANDRRLDNKQGNTGAEHTVNHGCPVKGEPTECKINKW